MIELINADCMDIMPQYEDNHFDLAVVDPPYGIGADKQIKFGKHQRDLHKSCDWDSSIPDKKYFIELFRISKNQVIWGGNYFINNLYNTKSFIVWDKMNGTNNLADCELAWTSFEKPVRLYRRHIFTGVGNTNYITIHPTQKPVKLYEWLLKNYAEAGQEILDTHLGSGSIAIACHYFGCDLVGIEIDKDYYDAAKKRIDNMTKQESLFI